MSARHIYLSGQLYIGEGVVLTIREEALRWFKQVEADLKKAVNDLMTHNWDSATFWSQQVAEKAPTSSLSPSKST